MSERKLRSDAGRPRKPEKTMRALLMEWYASLDAEQRMRVRMDLEMIEFGLAAREKKQVELPVVTASA